MLRYIELFAGCGGLSLGLKSVGFELIAVNELSPMAAETYALNFFNEDLEKLAKRSAAPHRTLWINSNHDVENLKTRLREDPRTFPNNNKSYCDIKSDGSNIIGSLLVGSIIELNSLITRNPILLQRLKTHEDNQEVDLISGGPPCQSFSMAGLRNKDSERNILPWEFAKFVEAIKPKIALLENVTGILRPFKDKNGDSYYAWFEIAKAFSKIGYIPLCLHVNAKLVGVPQNRPRFILIGLREDFYLSIEPTFNESEAEIFQQPHGFFIKSKYSANVSIDHLNYLDVAKASNLRLFESSFLKPLVTHADQLISVKEAIDDLRYSEASKLNGYPSELKKLFSGIVKDKPRANHILRKNGLLVKRRFRIYQALQQLSSASQKNIQNILRGEALEISDIAWKEISKFDFLTNTGDYKFFTDKSELVAYLTEHQTKKQTQRALIANAPAPAALSIPDDACHYHHDELRTLTVREMARIQSFPDHFEFRSKITTGGKMRQFEVPQYTQVGNAVPPLLGRALGITVKELLNRANPNGHLKK